MGGALGVNNGDKSSTSSQSVSSDQTRLQEDIVSVLSRLVALDKGLKDKLMQDLSSSALNTQAMLPKDLEYVKLGDEGTTDFRMQLMKADRPASLWHDVPLYEKDQGGCKTGNLHFICEIPKWTKKKFEISTNEKCTPVKQDEKKGELREFKTGSAGLAFNYGCFPQTWEDPEHVHPDAKHSGDNDPLDVCEIGTRQVQTGDIRPVKVLGVFCMIDEGEADWKVVAIDAADPWAAVLHDISDVEQYIPGMVDSIREWFRTYKVADGKPENSFELNEECKGRDYTMEIIQTCNASWLELIAGTRTRTEKTADLCRAYRPSMASLGPEELAKLQDLEKAAGQPTEGAP